MMRRILLLSVIAVMVGTMFVVVGAQRQDDDRQRKHDYARRQLEPDISSENWKPLSDDVGLMIYTMLSRVGFPYALEWLEGWTVDSASRILEGKSLFVKPGIEWVPYIYTPIYTYLAAGVSKLIGIGFLAPRLISIAAALGCLVFVHRLVARETGSVPCGLAAAGFLAGTFPLSGAWFDIGRVDTTASRLEGWLL